MYMKKFFVKLYAICLLGLTMLLMLPVTVNASAPKKEKISYLEKGKVEVEFLGDVEYRNPKVTAKDASGKKYKATIYSLDDDEIKFKIKNYKNGKKYKFIISGVRSEYTSKFGKVSGTVSIKKKSSKNITLEKAKKIAIDDAKKQYQISEEQVTNLYAKKDKDDGVCVYEIEFKADGWEYEYIISMKGKILERDRERD